MPKRAQSDLVWLLLPLLPAAAVLLAWIFNWPLSWAAALAVAAGGAGLTAVHWRARSGNGALPSELQALAAALNTEVDRDAASDPQSLLRALVALRTAAQAATLVSQRDLDNALESLRVMPWPVVVTDAAGNVVLSNRAGAEFFQRADGLTGRSIEDLIAQREVLTLHAAALAGQESEGRVRMQRADGPKIYQVLTRPVRLKTSPGATQAGALVCLRDITELAAAVQLKTDFVANASHELRTPLASIKAAVETLADGAWDDEAMRTRLTGMIAGNAARLEEMVRDLLDLSRLESAEAPVNIQPVSLHQLCEGLGEDFAPIAGERNVTLAFEISPQADNLRTDPKLLTLILKNLIDNAAKFAYEGTTVRVTAEAIPESAGVRVRVADKGVGIPISQQQRVFERFFQVDPARTGFAHRRGTGLGLAIVKHAVKALGGSISVESVWKEGTTMTVEIPGVLNAAPSRAHG